MAAVTIAPPSGRQHRRARRQRDDGKTLESPRRVAEKLALDSIRRTGMLVERKHHHVARGEPLQDRIERTALAQNTEAGAVKAPRHQLVEPARLDRTPD